MIFEVDSITFRVVPSIVHNNYWALKRLDDGEWITYHEHFKTYIEKDAIKWAHSCAAKWLQTND